MTHLEIPGWNTHQSLMIRVLLENDMAEQLTKATPNNEPVDWKASSSLQNIYLFLVTSIFAL